MTPYDSPQPPYYTPPRRIPIAVVITVGVVIALVVTLVAGAAGVYVNRARSSGHRAQSSATPTPTLGAASGTLVFTDDFHDSASGWPTGSLASGSSFEYSGGAYVAHAVGDLHHTAAAPYSAPFPRLSTSVTATQSTDAPLGAGFGVICVQGSGQQELRYELLIELGPEYYVEMRRGQLSITTAPVVLKQGTSSASPGSTPVTVVGDCITAADGKSTRLVLFVDGTMEADVTDPTPAPATGWASEIVISSRSARPSTVTVTRFEERDLSSLPGLFPTPGA